MFENRVQKRIYGPKRNRNTFQTYLLIASAGRRDFIVAMTKANTSETSVTVYQTTRLSAVEGRHLHTNRRENLNSRHVNL
jgi:hypothetical protein